MGMYSIAGHDGEACRRRNVVRQMWPTLAVVLDGTLSSSSVTGFSWFKFILKMKEHMKKDFCLFQRDIQETL